MSVSFMIFARFLPDEHPPCPDCKEHEDNNYHNDPAIVSRSNRERQRIRDYVVPPLVIIGYSYRVRVIPCGSNAKTEQGGGVIAWFDLTKERLAGT